MSRFRPFALRAAATVTAAGVFVLTGAGIASAHVTAHSPDVVAKGAHAEIVFRVPDEEATAHAVKVQVNFSMTSPIADADVKPMAGWTAKKTMVTLAKPVKMSKDTVTTAVQSITWTAPAGAGIAPGEFQEFSISAGLPDNTDQLFMPAVQTYDNGDVVNWNQPIVDGQPEPEHPAPHLALAPAGTDAATPVANTVSTATPATAAPASSDGEARLLGGIGVVGAALAIGISIGAFARRGRTPAGKQGASA
jgi:periplasmic copper chaperone A